MFVIGQFSNACNIDDLEDMRERMKAENSMLVIGGEELVKSGYCFNKNCCDITILGSVHYFVRFL